jgi:TfoX/Sxy family transcriptional regulator of competence genes
MSSKLSFVEFVVDQIENAGEISFRKMFGEYALYCNSKVVALICNNQLYVKPTKRGQSFIGNVTNAPPYPSAKPYFLIENQLENSAWLSELVRITADELPMPKPKRKKANKEKNK